MTTFNFAFNCCCSNLLQINKHRSHLIIVISVQAITLFSWTCQGDVFITLIYGGKVFCNFWSVCKFLCTFKIKLVLNLKTHIKMIKNVRAAVNTSVLENCYWSCNSKSLISFYISTFPYFTSAPHQRSDDGVTSKRPCCAFSAHMILTLRLRPWLKVNWLVTTSMLWEAIDRNYLDNM